MADTLLSKKEPQPFVLISDLPSSQLDLGRGFYALCFALPESLFDFLEVLFSPRARTSLVVADACEICFFLKWSAYAVFVSQ